MCRYENALRAFLWAAWPLQVKPGDTRGVEDEEGDGEAAAVGAGAVGLDEGAPSLSGKDSLQNTKRSSIIQSGRAAAMAGGFLLRGFRTRTCRRSITSERWPTSYPLTGQSLVRA